MYKVIAIIDKQTCENCTTVNEMIVEELVHVCTNGEYRCVVEKLWLCDWCKDYGKYPIDLCYHPMTEEPVLTNKNEKICHGCATSYREGKEL